MALYDSVEEGVQGVIATYKDAKSDGKVSFNEVVTLTGEAISALVVVAESFKDLTGADKKSVVLSAIGTFYDEVVAPIDIQKIPNFIEPILDKSIKQLLLAVSDGIIEAIVSLYNNNGWPGIGNSDESVV